MVNLSSKTLTQFKMEVLSIGLSVCSSTQLNKFDLILFTHKLCLKVLHHKSESVYSGLEYLMFLSKSECRALKELLESDNDELLDTPHSLEEELDLIDVINLEEYLVIFCLIFNR